MSDQKLDTSIVRCAGTWVYESSGFFSSKTEEKRVQGCLEFHLEHFPHPMGVKSITEASPALPASLTAAFGQCTPNSKIVLFNSGVPPPGSGGNAAFQKAVIKERAAATKCVIKFYELVNVHIVEDEVAKYGPSFAKHEIKNNTQSNVTANNTSSNQDSSDSKQQAPARRRIAVPEEEQNHEASSLSNLGAAAGAGSPSKHAFASGILSEEKIPEDSSPLTLAITFCVRAPGAEKVKGTEDIFGTPAERQDATHPLRSIKFVVEGIAATGGERITGGETPYKSLHDRFVDRVLHPIESFLLPEGKLHLFPIVSPVSGQGKGVKLYTDAQKIFRRSHHIVHPAIITKYRGHAEDWVANSEEFFFPVNPSLSPTIPQPKTAARSVIIPFGGDGMLHEVANGWFRRELMMQRNDDNESSTMNNSGDRSGLIETAEAFDRRPLFLPFPTGSGCAVAAALGVIDPVNCAMAAIHCHWTACDSFVVKPTGPARLPVFPKKEVEAPAAAAGEALNPKNTGAGPTLILPKNINDNKNDFSAKNQNQMLVANEELSGAGNINASCVGPRSDPTSPVTPDLANNNNNTVVVARSAAGGKALPPSWDCMSWAKLPDRVPPPRLGLLSVSTGLISDVDKGSETMRYLGNARFTVEMVRKVAGTTPKYTVICKYLPVLNPGDGKPVDSLDRITKDLKYKNPNANFPEPSIIKAMGAPLHDQVAPEVMFQPEKSYSGTAGSFQRSASIRQERSNRVAESRIAVAQQLEKKRARDDAAAAAVTVSGNKNSNNNNADTSASSSVMGDPPLETHATFGQMMSADSTGYYNKNNNNANDDGAEDPTNASEEKWVEFSSAAEKDKTFMIMVSNITAIAKDCIFAPFARYNDGALDVVGLDGTMGKVDLVSALLKLEDGTHVEGGTKDKVKYVKAKEVELEAKDGLIMCDGEIIPQCPVTIKCMPRSIKMVRTTLAEM